MSRILYDKSKIIAARKFDASGDIVGCLDGHAVHGDIALSTGNTLRSIDIARLIEIIIGFPIGLLQSTLPISNPMEWEANQFDQTSRFHW
jgi:hypothetical protein